MLSKQLSVCTCESSFVVTFSHHFLLCVSLSPFPYVQINKRLGDIVSQPNEDAKQAALAMAMYNIAKVTLQC